MAFFRKKAAGESALSKLKGAFKRKPKEAPVEGEEQQPGRVRRAGRWAGRGAGRFAGWAREKAPGAKSTLKHVMIISITIFIIFIAAIVLLFTGSGASSVSELTAKGGNVIADVKDSGDLWWNKNIECTLDHTSCRQGAEIVEGTEDAGIEISSVEADSDYFNEGEEIVIYGEMEYKPWKSEWAIESPRAEGIQVRVRAEDNKLKGKWECESPESMATPDFTCTHPPFESIDLVDPETGITQEPTARVMVYALYNFTTVGERKLFVMQRDEYYKKEEELSKTGYTEEKTIRSVGGPAEFVIGANLKWNDVIKLPMTTQKSVDLRVRNAETGSLHVTKIYAAIPTYLLDRGLQLDCVDGKRGTVGEFTYCTKTLSKSLDEGGESTAYKIKFDFSDNFVDKGIREIPIAGGTEYFYGTHKRTTIKLSIPSAEDVGEKDLYGTLRDEFKSRID